MFCSPPVSGSFPTGVPLLVSHMDSVPLSAKPSSPCRARGRNTQGPAEISLNPGLKCHKKLLLLPLHGCQVPTKATLLLPSSAGQGEKNLLERLMGQEKGRERSFTRHPYGQGNLTEENQFYYK